MPKITIKYYKNINEFKKENSLEGDKVTKPNIFPIVVIEKNKRIINLALSGGVSNKKLVDMIIVGLRVANQK